MYRACFYSCLRAYQPDHKPPILRIVQAVAFCVARQPFNLHKQLRVPPPALFGIWETAPAAMRQIRLLLIPVQEIIWLSLQLCTIMQLQPFQKSSRLILAAVVSVSPNRNYLCTPGPVTFTASGTGPYLWSFGDNSTETTDSAVNTHTYTAFGNYIISVTASNVQGCTATAFTQVRILAPAITATVLRKAGAYPATAQFTARVLVPAGAAYQPILGVSGILLPPSPRAAIPVIYIRR